jgi:hypothetical protein
MVSQRSASFIWTASLTNMFLLWSFIISGSMDDKLEHSLRLTLKIAIWWICKGKSWLKWQKNMYSPDSIK